MVREKKKEPLEKLSPGKGHIISGAEPIFEKLAPGEIYMISKDKNGCVEVAENENGKVVIRIVCPVKEQSVKKEKEETKKNQNKCRV
ncbi:MAG: hypothetical protein BWK75_06885 [Candidatus Altiarchaeales archaeon A3]|nr:MAG: hypothetical protein BWK75_06885 [Candidatus Altiarchaeales archaeon A3]